MACSKIKLHAIQIERWMYVACANAPVEPKESKTYPEPDESVDKFIERMEKEFEADFIGCGMECLVFKAKNEDWVVKLFKSIDDAQAAFNACCAMAEIGIAPPVSCLVENAFVQDYAIPYGTAEYMKQNGPPLSAIRWRIQHRLAMEGFWVGGDIVEIHQDNVGLYKGQPVCFDWGPLTLDILELRQC